MHIHKSIAQNSENVNFLLTSQFPYPMSKNCNHLTSMVKTKYLDLQKKHAWLELITPTFPLNIDEE